MDVEFIHQRVTKNRCKDLHTTGCRPCSFSDNTQAHNDGNRKSSGNLVQLKKAALLVGLQYHVKTGKWRYLLNLRKSALNRNGGEACFPGGMVDYEDIDFVDTALREAEEEIGLSRSQVDVVGALPPVISKHGVLVQIVVGIISSAFIPVANPQEVEDIFYVNLSEVCTGENHRMFWVMHCNNYLTSDFLDYEYEGHMYTVWGLTAAVLLLVSRILGMQPKCRHCRDRLLHIESEGGINEYLHKMALDFDKNGYMGTFKPVVKPSILSVNASLNSRL